MNVRGCGKNGEEGVPFKIVWNIGVKDTKRQRFIWRKDNRIRRSRRIEKVFRIKGRGWLRMRCLGFNR